VFALQDTPALPDAHRAELAGNTGATGPSGRRWLAYLAIGSVAIAAYYLLPTAGVAQAILLCSVNASGAVLAFRAARKVHRRTKRIWLWLALAVTMFTLANVSYYGYRLVSGHSLPFPSPTDVLFLSTYPCFAVALAAMASQRRRGDRRGDTLDAAIVIIGGGLAMWSYIIAPVVATAMPALTHTVAVAYPCSDLVIFAFLVRFLVADSRPNGSSQLLLGSFIALLAADTVYALELARGTYQFGGPPDALWMLSYLLVGAAALHPTAPILCREDSSSGHRISRGRIAFLCVAVLAGPVVVALHPGPADLAAAVSAVLFLLVMSRVTSLNHQLVSASLELESRATTDSLTGLANGATFSERLRVAYARPQRRHGTQAVLFVDLDDFKEVNDTLGHAAGDELLRIMANRLRAAVRPADLVARLGGDEFALLLDGIAGGTAALLLAERTVAALARPVEMHGVAVHVGASIGVAQRSGAADPVELMRQADVAMYAAKRLGKNRAAGYDRAIDQAAGDSAALRADLFGVVERGELVVDYQPVVGLQTGRIVGVEALVRWQHRDRGLLPPSTFIHLAETTSAIIEIGTYVLDRACRDIRRLQERTGASLSVAVNVSVRQLARPGFEDVVVDILDRAGLGATSLVLEITESLFIEPTSEISQLLHRLRRHGIRVAIDDFGTGYSSIGYLQHLPVDIVKIDKTFVSGDQAGPQAHAVLEGIVGLAQTLGLDVIAEGIEEPQQLEFLKSLGCQAGQGYLLSQPAPVAAIETLLELQRATSPLKSTEDEMTFARSS
jgi:diguanylate cyclase (GGDEF)-like protein